MKWVLIDTNILLAWLQRATWGLEAMERAKRRPDCAGFATSIICTGEIRAIAKGRGWGDDKRSRLGALLDTLPILDVSEPKVVEAYASIRTWTRGKRVEPPGHEVPPTPARPMSDNDLWIAATAHALKLPLLSSDSDFFHLDNIWFDLIRVSVTK